MMAPFPAVGRQRGVIHHRKPDVGRWAQHVLECRGHYTDDGDRYVLEQDLTSDNRPIGTEPSPPQAIADQRNERSARPIVGSLEVASQSRSHTQHTKIVGADALPVES